VGEAGQVTWINTRSKAEQKGTEVSEELRVGEANTGRMARMQSMEGGAMGQVGQLDPEIRLTEMELAVEIQLELQDCMD